jgi:hypothetical protein
MDGTAPAHWVFADFLDACKIPVICQIVSLIISGEISNKNYFDFAWDLFEADWRQQSFADLHTEMREGNKSYYVQIV